MNRAPFPSASGPSQIAGAFYLPGHYTPPAKTRQKIDKRRKQVDVAALKAYRATNKTLAECGRRFGLDRGTVSSLLKEPKRTRTKVYIWDKDKGLSLWLDGMSFQAIATALKCSRTVVREYINGLNLPAETFEARLARIASRRTHMLDIHLCLRPDQIQMYRRLGGAVWLRALIDERMGVV